MFRFPVCYFPAGPFSGKELGVSLLSRENRHFSLTPAGEYFYTQSLSLTQGLENICKETSKMGLSHA